MIPATDMIEPFDRHLAATLRGDAGPWPFAPGAIDAEDLWERVQFHGIAGLLAERIGALHDWPDRLRTSVRQEAQMQAFWEESHRALLCVLLARLAQGGAISLLMKGSALAYALYSDPSSRRRGDSDLLVDEADLALTRRVLAETGFVRRDDPHGLFFQEAWLADTGIGIIHAIDLHWRPSDSPAVQQVLRTGEYFSSSTPLPRLSPDAAMPDFVLTFVQGAINQAWHGSHGYYVEGERLVGGSRLIWAWDNHLLAGAFSDAQWRELAELAVSRKVAPLCLAALERAQASCGTMVPQAVIEQLTEASGETTLANHILETNLISTFITDLSSIRPWRDKGAFILGHAFPDRQHLARKYPNIAGWPAPLLHLRRMIESAIRLARLR